MSQPRAFAVVTLLACACIARAADERVIRYSDNTLTVKVTKAPLADVLDEILRDAGAQLRGAPRNTGDVTVDFEDVPVQEGLHRLLGDQNFMLVYAGDGHLRGVRLLGGPLAPGAHAMTAAGPPQAAPTDMGTLIANHGPVQVTGPLQDAVGGGMATIPQLVQLSVHHEDPTVRSAAVRAVVSTMEADPALRAALIEQLKSSDDVQLSAMLRGAAGDRAEEVAMQVLTQARASEIRVKASSVLQKLRAGS
ncbi:MAG TPA: hypothetical protein VKU61_13290 [Candidatus Binatia bacterium]|nr:hypothetical protein [Candidatus Binatia bacterium]